MDWKGDFLALKFKDVKGNMGACHYMSILFDCQHFSVSTEVSTFTSVLTPCNSSRPLGDARRSSPPCSDPWPAWAVLRPVTHLLGMQSAKSRLQGNDIKQMTHFPQNIKGR